MILLLFTSTSSIIRAIIRRPDEVRTSETSVYSETTRRYIPEGSNLKHFLCSANGL
jgi:hypothetical protein